MQDYRSVTAQDKSLLVLANQVRCHASVLTVKNMYAS